MTDFDVSPIYDLGNQWIATGDRLQEHAANLLVDVTDMRSAWTGRAGQAAFDTFASPHGVGYVLTAAAQTAWKVGEAINIYGQELQKAVREINRQRVIDALVGAFSSILDLATFGLGLYLGPLLEEVSAALELLTTWLSKLDNWVGAVWRAADFAANAVTASAGEFVTELPPAFATIWKGVSFTGEAVVAGGGSTVGFDLAAQAIAGAITHTPLKIDWASEGLNAGLGTLMALGGPNLEGPHFRSPHAGAEFEPKVGGTGPVKAPVKVKPSELGLTDPHPSEFTGTDAPTPGVLTPPRTGHGPSTIETDVLPTAPHGVGASDGAVTGPTRAGDAITARPEGGQHSSEGPVSAGRNPEAHLDGPPRGSAADAGMRGDIPRAAEGGGGSGHQDTAVLGVPGPDGGGALRDVPVVLQPRGTDAALVGRAGDGVGAMSEHPAAGPGRRGQQSGVLTTEGAGDTVPGQVASRPVEVGSAEVEGVGVQRGGVVRADAPVTASADASAEAAAEHGAQSDHVRSVAPDSPVKAPQEQVKAGPGEHPVEAGTPAGPAHEEPHGSPDGAPSGVSVHDGAGTHPAASAGRVFREGGESDPQALPPEPHRQLVDEVTDFSGIYVRWDRDVDPTFFHTVTEQLKLIGSTPTGRALLDDIANAPHSSTLPAWQQAKVKIQRVGAGTVIDAEAAVPVQAGNVTVPLSNAWATRAGENPGHGTLSLVKYNPNVWKTPDGVRPPFVGLAHELIHVQRNLRGLSRLDTALDEAEVVGFGPHAGQEFTENKIREEHGLSSRVTYKGVSSDVHGPLLHHAADPVHANIGQTWGLERGPLDTPDLNAPVRGKATFGVTFEAGVKSELSTAGRAELDGIAERAVNGALVNWRLGRPLPTIRVTGYGNGRLGHRDASAALSAASRAETVAEELRKEVATRLADESAPKPTAADFSIDHVGVGHQEGMSVNELRRVTVTIDHDHPHVALGSPGEAPAEVAKNLHFVWLGGEMSDAARSNLDAWSAQAERTGWTAHLWTDEGASRGNADYFAGLTDAGWEIHRSHQDLFSDADVGPRAVLSEATSNHAFAMASDVIRYGALRRHGGVYLDVDIAPGSVHLPTEPILMDRAGIPFFAPSVRDHRHLDFITDRVNERAQQAGVPVPARDAGSLMRAVDHQYESGDLNNNLIVAPSGSEFIGDLLAHLKQPGSPGFPAGREEMIRNAPQLSGPFHIKKRLEQALRDGGQWPTESGHGDLPLRVPYATAFRRQYLVWDRNQRDTWRGLDLLTEEAGNQELPSTPAPSDIGEKKGTGPARGQETADPSVGHEFPTREEALQAYSDAQRDTAQAMPAFTDAQASHALGAESSTPAGGAGMGAAWQQVPGADATLARAGADWPPVTRESLPGRTSSGPITRDRPHPPAFLDAPRPRPTEEVKPAKGNPRSDASKGGDARS